MPISYILKKFVFGRNLSMAFIVIYNLTEQICRQSLEIDPLRRW